MIRVVVADDHAIVRAGLRALLEAEGDVAVVGEAPDGRAAIEVAARAHPDVLLLDLSMPGAGGVEAVRRAGELDPPVAVLVLSMHAAAEYVRPALRAGARGYLVKGAGLDDLVRALRAVAAGGRFLGPEAQQVVARGLPDDTDELDRLTPREREVLQLVAEGRTNREIARSLGVAPKTVDAHRTRLMQKLDLHDGRALTRWALRRGIIE